MRKNYLNFGLLEWLDASLCMWGRARPIRHLYRLLTFLVHNLHVRATRCASCSAWDDVMIDSVGSVRFTVEQLIRAKMSGWFMGLSKNNLNKSDPCAGLDPNNFNF